MNVLRDKRQTSFRLPTYLLNDLKAEAKQQHRSLNSLVEVYLSRLVYHEPNETTLAAMRECESGMELDDFSPEALDQYIYEDAETVTQFKKDLKRYLHHPQKMQALKTVTMFLREHGYVPSEYKPHRLSGNYKGFLECHVEDDYLLIWIDDETDVIKLVRLGTHHELFGK